jgi:hypothetical protein
MAKFLVLAYYDPDRFDALSADEKQALVSQCPPHDAALRDSGNLLTIASLGELRASVSVRPRGGKPTVTDGPFMETKEQLGSFFLIEAADMADAVRIASLHPAARIGEQAGWGIEIRPVDYFAEPGR